MASLGRYNTLATSDTAGPSFRTDSCTSLPKPACLFTAGEFRLALLMEEPEPQAVSPSDKTPAATKRASLPPAHLIISRSASSL